MESVQILSVNCPHNHCKRAIFSLVTRCLPLVSAFAELYPSIHIKKLTLSFWSHYLTTAGNSFRDMIFFGSKYGYNISANNLLDAICVTWYTKNIVTHTEKWILNKWIGLSYPYCFFLTGLRVGANLEINIYVSVSFLSYVVFEIFYLSDLSVVWKLVKICDKYAS